MSAEQIEQPADPIVISVYAALIQPTIDGFCVSRSNATPEEIAAVTHHAILTGTSLIRIFRIAAGLDQVEVLSGLTETALPTFEYTPTPADTPEKREQIASWVAAYLQGGRVGGSLPAALPEEPAPTTCRWGHAGQYL